ncbi:MAG TPA: CAP domain-containing protein [Nocardioides sp.]|nr:CAP domain-containing protein [Nocardioides sp.]
MRLLPTVIGSVVGTVVGTVVLVLGPLPAPAPASAPGPAAASRSAMTAALETDVLKEVNRARARAGCRALRTHSAVRTAARRHSALMARRGSLTHRFAGEPSVSRRVALAGYSGASMVGEVIAVSRRSAADTARMWLGSRVHRRLLLDCRFRDAGAGVAISSDGRRWWTVDLARR